MPSSTNTGAPDPRRELWIKLCGLNDTDAMEDHRRICGKHFRDDDYRPGQNILQPYAIPSLYLPERSRVNASDTKDPLDVTEEYPKQSANSQHVLNLPDEGIEGTDEGTQDTEVNAVADPLDTSDIQVIQDTSDTQDTSDSQDTSDMDMEQIKLKLKRQFEEAKRAEHEEKKRHSFVVDGLHIDEIRKKLKMQMEEKKQEKLRNQQEEKEQQRLQRQHIVQARTNPFVQTCEDPGTHREKKSCHICGMTFSHPVRLGMHLNTHTGINHSM